MLRLPWVEGDWPALRGTAELWLYIYDPVFGIADRFLQAIGAGHPTILGANVSAITAMMVADIWKTTPFVAIIVLAGLVVLAYNSLGDALREILETRIRAR